MAGLRIAILCLGSAVLLCSCGPSGGGEAASSTPAASSAALSSAPAAASDTALSSPVPSALPPVAAASPAPAAAPKREPTPAELLRDDPAYVAKARSIEALYENAKDRDPTGQVEGEQNAALAQRRACADRACLDAWFRRREAALRQYVEN